ncbi:MAG: hypothetical protein JO112_18260, partial [Planctomycetes bacterium]|nr:hypothetical protein [Planctomycetota bacterium]
MMEMLRPGWAAVCFGLLWMGADKAAANRLAVAEVPASGGVKQLIHQLGSLNFREREAAAQALAVLGEPALAPLRQAAVS